MNIVQIILCVCLSMVFGNDKDESDSNISSNESTILVVIHPSSLIDDGLLESWQTINEPFGKRQIQARPHSTVNYSLQPIQSIDGAALRLTMNGSSVGESKATTGAREVVSNTLTQFNAYQMVLINDQEMAFTPPLLQVESNQSFNRTSAHNRSQNSPLANSLARTGYRLFEDQLKSDANVFARQQVQRQIRLRNQRTTERYYQMRAQLKEQYPVVSQFDWRLSSDENHIYITTGTNRITIPPPDVKYPATLLVTTETVNHWLADSLANEKFDAERIRESYSDLAKQVELPDMPKSDGNEDWFVHLDEHPIKIAFDNNKIRGELSASEYSSGGKSLMGMTVVFQYEIQQGSDGWVLLRNDEIEVVSRNSEENSGARQQVLRTIMRNRFDKIFPKRIPIPEVGSPLFNSELEIDFQLKNINANNGWLAIAFDKK